VPCNAIWFVRYSFPWNRSNQFTSTGNDLSEDDWNAIRAHNYRVDTNIGARSYSKLSRAFPSLGNLPSLQQLQTRIRFLSGVQPVPYHCCIKSCCCYTGPYATLTKCPYCDEPRLTELGKPRKLFFYLPIIPRLVSLYGNKEMANVLQYRHNYTSKPGTTADVFDSEHYQNLRKTRVTIGGETLGHNFFSQPTDIALGLSTDGFGPFKRRKHTCWPLILFIYNFPPAIRCKLASLHSLGVIPGHKAPKDYDSFLLPVVEELFKLSRGVPAFDAEHQRIFMLFAYLILAFGDMPALAKLLRLKGHNAISPCRACRILGIRNANSGKKRNPYYTPLHRPTGQSYDPLKLPLRTHDEFMRQAIQVAMSPSDAEEKRRAVSFGIYGVPLLSTLSSLSIPSSFPHDFMHIIENIIPALISLWTGTYKGLDTGSEQYQIHKTVWEAIGQACTESGCTMPSSFGCRVPNIATERHHFIAESWFLFATLLGPVLLRQRFAQPTYYQHFVHLVKLINLCLKLEITITEIDEIEKGFAEWVQEYERYVSH
jgi:Transposase family tnp2